MNTISDVKPLLIIEPSLDSRTRSHRVLVVIDRFECVEGWPCPQILNISQDKTFMAHVLPVKIFNLENFRLYGNNYFC